MRADLWPGMCHFGGVMFQNSGKIDKPSTEITLKTCLYGSSIAKEGGGFIYEYFYHLCTKLQPSAPWYCQVTVRKEDYMAQDHMTHSVEQTKCNYTKCCSSLGCVLQHIYLSIKLDNEMQRFIIL